MNKILDLRLNLTIVLLVLVLVVFVFLLRKVTLVFTLAFVQGVVLLDCVTATRSWS